VARFSDGETTRSGNSSGKMLTETDKYGKFSPHPKAGFTRHFSCDDFESEERIEEEEAD